MHYVSKDAPGYKRLLLGNEAIARGAVEAGIQVAAAYPGTPSSEVLETLIEASKDLKFHAQWSINEKVAFNVAAGAAIVGARALFACKNAGLNWAMDDFVTLAYTGIRGSLVVVVADDPDAHYSSTEQDTRLLSMHANIPIFEPMDAQEAKDMTKMAFEVSEKLQLPVFLRSVTRISHASGDVEYGEITKDKNPIAFDKHWGLPFRWDVYGPPGPVGKRKWLIEQQKKAKEIVETLPFNKLEVVGGGKLGVVASGLGNAYTIDALQELGLKENVNFLKIGTPYPLPEKKVVELLKMSSKIIVIEEGDPVVEAQIREIAQKEGLTSSIVGKMFDDNVLPKYGELTPELVINALAKFANISRKDDKNREKIREEVSKLVAPRSSMLCPGCQHLGTLWAIRQGLNKVKAKVPIINVGIGCYEMSGYGIYGKKIDAKYTEKSTKHVIYYPYEMADVEYVMGTEFGMSQGEYAAGYADGPILGLAGDSSFFHANLQSLANAVYNGFKGVFVVLDNHWTAMTGHQPNPRTAEVQEIEPASVLSIEDIVKAMGIKFVKVVDPYNIKEGIEVMQEALKYDGLAVVIFRRECALQAVRRKRWPIKTYVVDEEKCTGCKLCVYLGCSAVGFNYDTKKAFIDPLLCIGCDQCAQVCPFDAISPKRGE
ncbi:MAG: 4Fe-4S binding protein [Candidatus Odinarchaeota archaeon]|nr:4Fe-4S binding protein [Candidatus Odinarchaeota archaeon]